MAQIFVFGRVMNDLVPKESQSKQSYVCFDLMERTKNWTQFYHLPRNQQGWGLLDIPSLLK